MSEFQRIVQILNELNFTPSFLQNNWNYKNPNHFKNDEEIEKQLDWYRQQNESSYFKKYNIEEQKNKYLEYNKNYLENLKEFEKLNEWDISIVYQDRCGSEYDYYKMIFLFKNVNPALIENEIYIKIIGSYNSQDGYDFDDCSEFEQVKKVKIETFVYENV